MSRTEKIVGWLTALVGLVMVLTMPVNAGPIELTKASMQEAALHGGATHYLDIDVTHQSFDAYSTSNQMWATTNALAANTYVRLTLMELVKTFDAATTTEALYVNSGWAASSNIFLYATQVASDGTEVYYATAPMEWVNSAPAWSGGTNIVTNITTTAYGFQYCTTATNLITQLHPNSLTALSDWTQGRVRLWYQIFTP